MIQKSRKGGLKPPIHVIAARIAEALAGLSVDPAFKFHTCLNTAVAVHVQHLKAGGANVRTR